MVEMDMHPVDVDSAIAPVVCKERAPQSGDAGRKKVSDQRLALPFNIVHGASFQSLNNLGRHSAFITVIIREAIGNWWSIEQTLFFSKINKLFIIL
jgi:hypothetical protein